MRLGFGALVVILVSREGWQLWISLSSTKLPHPAPHRPPATATRAPFRSRRSAFAPSAALGRAAQASFDVSYGLLRRPQGLMQRCNGPCWRPQGSLERSIRTCWRLPPLPGAGGGLPCPRNDGLGRRDEGLPHVFLVLGRRAETVRNVDRILRPRAERSKNVWPVLGSRAEHLKNVWQVLGRRAETMKILERQRGRCLVAGVWGRAVIGIRDSPSPRPSPQGEGAPLAAPVQIRIAGWADGDPGERRPRAAIPSPRGRRSG